MAGLLLYSLKVSVALLFFYLIYRLACGQNKFFRANRACILLFYICSLFIFLIPVKTDTPSLVQQTIANYEEIFLTTEITSTEQIFPAETTVSNTSTNSVVIDWISIAGIIYLMGMLFLLARNVYSVLRIFFVVRGCEKKKIDGAILFLSDRDIPSFSWMKYIIISRKDYNENSQIVLTHELSHIKNKHSIDLLLSEIFTLFQWYNPIAWLFRRELCDVHEFEADNSVLKSGIDAKTYQILLIKKAAGSQHLTFMTNSFNHSKLEKRITMMLKESNNPYAGLKYLLLVPAFAIAVSVFARPELVNRIDELSEAESTEKKADLQTKPTDPSDTIDLKKYRVEGYIDGKRVNFNSWKNFERKDGNILISMDSAIYYKGDKMLAYTKGGTLHIPEKTMNLNADAIQRRLIAVYATPFERQDNIVNSVGGYENFLNSIDLKKFRVEAYLNGKRIDFDQWKNFREKDDYIVVDIDSAIYYNGNKRIGREFAIPNPFQVNISKNTKNLNGETIQRGMISSNLLQKGINPNE
ncbi:MAG: M56 family metallopeptidase [Dysgonomonas sp.]